MFNKFTEAEPGQSNHAAGATIRPPSTLLVSDCSTQPKWSDGHAIVNVFEVTLPLMLLLKVAVIFVGFAATVETTESTPLVKL